MKLMKQNKEVGELEAVVWDVILRRVIRKGFSDR